MLVGLSVGDTTLGTLVANLGYDKLVFPDLRRNAVVVEFADTRDGVAGFLEALRNADGVGDVFAELGLVFVDAGGIRAQAEGSMAGPRCC